MILASLFYRSYIVGVPSYYYKGSLHILLKYELQYQSRYLIEATPHAIPPPNTLF